MAYNFSKHYRNWVSDIMLRIFHLCSWEILACTFVVCLVLPWSGFVVMLILASWSKLDSILSSSIIWKKLCKIGINLSSKAVPLLVPLHPHLYLLPWCFWGEEKSHGPVGTKRLPRSGYWVFPAISAYLPASVSLSGKGESWTQQRRLTWCC